jgi:TRAP-type mannitol/chloroaromatic compound transport system permease small subunit
MPCGCEVAWLSEEAFQIQSIRMEYMRIARWGYFSQTNLGSVLNEVMDVLKWISSGIDQLNEQVGRAVSWLSTALVVLVCFDVLTRYLLNDTQTWIMELEWHLFALLFLLGAGYALKHDRHVRVDLFYNRFSPRDQAWVQLAGGLFFLIPWAILICWFSFDYARISWLLGEASSDPGGLPARYLIKGAIPIGFALLALQGVSEVIKAVITLREGPQEA